MPNSFPPIKTLFTDSWIVFKKSLLNVFLIGLINTGLFIALLIILGLTFATTGIFNLLGSSQFDSAAVLTKLFNPVSSIIFLLVLVGYMIFQIAIQAAIILAVGQADKNEGVGVLIKRGFSLIIPLFLTSFIVGFLSWGGLMLFVIPAIIFGILFSFVSYEVILNGKKYLEAIKTSVQIVSQHFGDVFVRMLMFFLGTILVTMLIPGFIRLFEPKDAQVMSSLVSSILNAVLGWYGLSYSVTLYRQARVLTDFEKKSSLVWIFAVAIIGWVVGVFILLGTASVLKTQWPTIMETVSKAQSTSSPSAQTAL